MNRRTSVTTSPMRLKSITITAVFIALTYIFTAFINVCIPPGNPAGLTHLGNIPVLIAAIIFGKKIGAVTGGVGMALFDLFSPWAIWSPFTFVIMGVTGYVVGMLTEKHRKIGWYLLAVLAAAAIKVVGYYLAEGIIYGNWVTPAVAIPANLLQVAVAAVAVLPIIGRLRASAEKLL